MHPFSSRAFQRDQDHDMKHPSSVDLISPNKTKQTNNLPSWIFLEPSSNFNHFPISSDQMFFAFMDTLNGIK